MKYIKNLGLNLIPLSLLLYGILGMGPFAAEALFASVTLYILIILISLMLPFVPPGVFFEDRINLKKLTNTTTMLGNVYDKNYNYFNVVFDLIVVLIMAYFGLNLLAAFYVVHILAYLILQNHIKNYIADKFKPEMFNLIPINLQEAIDRGETSFSFYELMGLEHPNQHKKENK